MTLFGTTATSPLPVAMRVERQFTSRTRPSTPPSTDSTSPARYSRSMSIAMPENTSDSVLCRTRPITTAITPEVAMRLPTGTAKTTSITASAVAT